MKKKMIILFLLMFIFLIVGAMNVRAEDVLTIKYSIDGGKHWHDWGTSEVPVFYYDEIIKIKISQKDLTAVDIEKKEISILDAVTFLIGGVYDNDLSYTIDNYTAKSHMYSNLNDSLEFDLIIKKDKVEENKLKKCKINFSTVYKSGYVSTENLRTFNIFCKDKHNTLAFYEGGWEQEVEAINVGNDKDSIKQVKLANKASKDAKTETLVNNNSYVIYKYVDTNSLEQSIVIQGKKEIKNQIYHYTEGQERGVWLYFNIIKQGLTEKNEEKDENGNFTGEYSARIIIGSPQTIDLKYPLIEDIKQELKGEETGKIYGMVTGSKGGNKLYIEGNIVGKLENVQIGKSIVLKKIEILSPGMETMPDYIKGESAEKIEVKDISDKEVEYTGITQIRRGANGEGTLYTVSLDDLNDAIQNDEFEFDKDIEDGTLGIIKTFLGYIQFFGIVIGTIGIALLGFRYIMGSASEKADYKKTLATFTIGIVILMVGTSLVSFILNIVLNW